MMRSFWLASAAALSAALLTAACASAERADDAAAAPRTAQPTQPAAPSAPTIGGFTDAQVQAYVAASGEIDPINSAATTDAERAAAAQQIGAILQRHNLAPDVYNSIAAAARTDQALADRIAALRTGSVTDAQLHAFAAASLEIDPISRAAASAPPEQRQQAATQIRAILARHNLDSETYNGIAARAQTDAALAARIAQLQVGMQPQTAPSNEPSETEGGANSP
jgi:hypothetical protein